MEVVHVPGQNAGNIKLFALSTCGWCRKTKQLLTDLGVQYDYVDVDHLPGDDRTEVMKMVEKWNPDGSFPTMVINDSKCIVGFKEDEIKKVLKK